MTPHNSYLVDYEVVAVGEGAGPYPAHAEWAEPSVEHAARLMRQVFDRRDEARAKGRRAAADIRRTHSARRAGQEMRDRLARVTPPPPAPGHDPLIDRLDGRVAAGPVAQRGRVRHLLRSLVLRLIKPFTAYQVDVNTDTVNALRHLAQQVETMRAEQLRRAREAAQAERPPAPAPVAAPAPALAPARDLTAAVEHLGAVPDGVSVTMNVPA
jgi:hypothetical protein